MSIKLKALGLGLLATAFTSAFVVMNASANVNGHFVTASEHTFVTGVLEKGTEHEVYFVSEDGSVTGCDIQQYAGTHKSATKTTTEFTITPQWEQCYTKPDGTKFNIDENGCHLVFTSRAPSETNDATAHVTCPAGKAIIIKHPNCETTVVPQTVGGAPGDGFAYANKDVEVAGKADWITMSITVNVATAYHGGICTFLGTNHSGTVSCAVTVTGFSDATYTTRTNITAT